MHYAFIKNDVHFAYFGFNGSQLSAMVSMAYNVRVYQKSLTSFHIYSQVDYGRQKTYWWDNKYYDDSGYELDINEVNTGVRVGLMTNMRFRNGLDLFVMLESGYFFNNTRHISNLMEGTKIHAYRGSDDGQWTTLGAGMGF